LSEKADAKKVFVGCNLSLSLLGPVNKILIHNKSFQNPSHRRTVEEEMPCLHEILEESSEEESEKRTSQIQALVPVVITIIQLTAS
jgi:hypothetical protein